MRSAATPIIAQSPPAHTHGLTGGGTDSTARVEWIQSLQGADATAGAAERAGCASRGAGAPGCGPAVAAGRGPAEGRQLTSSAERRATSRGASWPNQGAEAPRTGTALQAISPFVAPSLRRFVASLSGATAAGGPR
jgi:hypothetical protein